MLPSSPHHIAPYNRMRRHHQPAASIIAGLVLVALMSGCHRFHRPDPPQYQTLPEDLTKDEEHASTLHAKAVRHMDRGDLDGAEKLLKKALDIDVSFGPAHNTLGKVYYRQHKLYLAAWEFQYAAKLMPERSEPINNLGLTFEKAGRIDEAIEWYERGLDVTPGNPDIVGNLVRAKIRRGDQDSEVDGLLEEVLVYDSRRNWIQWAEDQLIHRRVKYSSPASGLSEKTSMPPKVEKLASRPDSSPKEPSKDKDTMVK